jgi:hypothetical protein
MKVGPTRYRILDEVIAARPVLHTGVLLSDISHSPIEPFNCRRQPSWLVFNLSDW